MLAIPLKHARPTVPAPTLRHTCAGARRSYRRVANRQLTGKTAAEHPLAEQLLATGVWGKSRRRGGGGSAAEKAKKAGSTEAVEARRVNIVSEKLCDDIFTYVGSTLERHRGCDLIDLNPGAGLWSRKLHDFLQPRRHVMMDADAELYKPFLTDLLAKDNVEMVAKSGFKWKNLVEMLETKFPDLNTAANTSSSTTTNNNDTKRGNEDVIPRNDALLVTANLSSYPKKSFLGFDDLSTLLAYQFISSIRTQSLFQRYGLVRMLLWVNPDDKTRHLPRSLARRRRGALEAEFSCEWVREVAGPDPQVMERTALRDEWINLESTYNTMARMKEQGFVVPSGDEEQRKTAMLRQAESRPEWMGKRLAGQNVPVIDRPFVKELADLRGKEGKTTEEMARAHQLKLREKYEGRRSDVYLDLLQQRERIFEELARNPQALAAAVAAADAGPDSNPPSTASPSPGDLSASIAAFNTQLANLKKNPRNEFAIIHDNYHLFRQPSNLSPILHWDRRPYEPLAASDTEFFPNAPTALLDIQPKSMAPVLRQYGPGTSSSGDFADLMLAFWIGHSAKPIITEAMDALWPGFGALSGECPSLVDPNRGGSPLGLGLADGGSGNGSKGSAALKVRTMNEGQWVELVEAFMGWPFRPSFARMVGKTMDERAGGEDEVAGDMQGAAMGMS